ncbi:MAG: hypothetical protein LBE51_19615 [Acidovorax sp.]|jgi:hypothetical protein|nr:hypothetical protein [Acidovorax sp.]
MHEDTQVELEYLFLPDPEHSPELVILQKDAPTPLIFTTGGFFSDPIAKEKIEPVGAPR